MKREFKFRVCYTDQRGTKQTIYKDEDLMLSLNGTVYENYGTKEDPTWEPVFDAYEQPFIQQFTGMKDKNSKEIYEGDIIKYPIPVGWTTNSLHREDYRVDEVKFISGCFIPDIWRTVVDECEVIGNVFEKDIKLDTSS
jgi:uncharacterized phage protein (TIGR01671 family)